MNYCSDGIMGQIQFLVAPPVSAAVGATNTSRNKGDQIHPSYKKAGRGHNRDICDACAEGGELLSCDSCPATFHLICHNPPLEECDIPSVGWRCHHCTCVKEAAGKAQPKKSVEEPLPSSSKSIQSLSRKNVKQSRHVAAREAVENWSILQKVNDSAVSSTSGSVIKNFFDQVLHHCSTLNPIVFTLPQEYECYDYQFPGSSRPLIKKQGSMRPKSALVEMENGIVMKPVAFCNTCGKSSRWGALVRCDYCPVFYHMDCLNPPLPVPPTGIWQCPLHLECKLEENLLRSISLTERVRLWDRSREPINQSAVVNKFFRKVHRSNPPFHHKVPLHMKNRAKIPTPISSAYEQLRTPPIRYRRKPRSSPPYLCLQKLETTALKGMMYFKILGCGNSKCSFENVEPVCKTNKLEAFDIRSHSCAFPVLEVHSIEPIRRRILVLMLRLLSIIIQDALRHFRCICEKSKYGIFRLFYFEYLKYCGIGDWRTPSKKCGQGLYQKYKYHSMESNYELPVVAKKTNQKIRKNESLNDNGADLRSKIDLAINLKGLDLLAEVTDYVESTEDKYIENILQGYDLKTIRRLAAEKLTDGGWQDVVFKPPEFDNRLLQSVKTGHLKPMLSLMCWNTRKKITLRTKSISIGTGDVVVLDLFKIIKCKRVSPRHAAVYYDHVQSRWELVNYSPHGTIVDGCFLGCGLTSDIKNSPSSRGIPDFVLKKYLHEKNSIVGGLFRTGGPVSSTFKQGVCFCQEISQNESLRSWEGPIPLSHNSYIEIGCLKFLVLGFDFSENIVSKNSYPVMPNASDSTSHRQINKHNEGEENRDFGNLGSSVPTQCRTTDQQETSERGQDVNTDATSLSSLPGRKRKLVMHAKSLSHPCSRPGFPPLMKLRGKEFISDTADSARKIDVTKTENLPLEIVQPTKP